MPDISESTPENSLEPTPVVDTVETTESTVVISSPSVEQESSAKALPSPLNSLTGALIAGTFAMGLYKLTQAIATSFATKPLTSTNPLALSISAAVRTLVVGASTLATGIFAIAAFSLVLLAFQVALQSQKTKSTQ